ncbi:MAG: hypothetical protein ACK55Z_28830, partial [bacterium]
QLDHERINKEIEEEDGAIYKGHWKNGIKEGYGKQRWKDGSVYEGDWKDGMVSGKGKLIHANGDVYDGQW